MNILTIAFKTQIGIKNSYYSYLVLQKLKIYFNHFIKTIPLQEIYCFAENFTNIYETACYK